MSYYDTGAPDFVTVPDFSGEGHIGTTRQWVREPGPGQLLIQCKATALCEGERSQWMAAKSRWGALRRGL